MATPDLPLTGRNVALNLFINGAPTQMTDLATSFSISEVNVQYRDKYLNRNRDRVDEQTIGYDAKIDLHYAGSKLIQALLAQKAAREANQAIPTISIGFTMKNRNGTTDAYVLQTCTTKFEINFKGKD